MTLTEFDEKVYEELIRQDSYEEGLADGEERGLERGQMERLRMNVLSMLEKGMQSEDVAFYLELSVQEVEAIRSLEP